MKLNVLSDLHLSLGALPLPENDADVVILAGDVARPKEAIAWAAGFAKPVLYVPGNHEFYGGSIEGTLEALEALSEGTRVRVLDDEAVVIDGVRFLGSPACSPTSARAHRASRAAAGTTRHRHR